MTGSFVTHLECSATKERLPAGEIANLSMVGKPLLVRYDLPRISKELDRDALASRHSGMWKCRELLPLPVEANLITLGEEETPLIPVPSLGSGVLVKDEGRLPTGSFKARGLAMAVNMAALFRVKRAAMPSNGNAGAAMAAYASRAGIESYVFCPEDTPEINLREIALQGGHVWRVNGLIHECGRLVGQGQAEMGWFDMSTLKEPYRIEGKKTMGIELADQLGWTLPDVIFYPTGGGTGLIGMWKAFLELRELGWISGPLPRMVAVQASGCAPIVRAWKNGANHAEEWLDATTVAAGIRVPAAIGDFLILDAVRESDGFAIAVNDAEIIAARESVGTREGLLLCPEGAATVAAWSSAVESGLISRSDRAVLFNCGSGLKYPMPTVDRRLEKEKFDARELRMNAQEP